MLRRAHLVTIALVLGPLGHPLEAGAERPPHPVLSPRELAAQWNVVPLADGVVHLEFEARFGTRDRHVRLEVSDRLVPARGEVRYADGQTRSMSDGEVRYFWTGVGGAEAAWRHAQEVGRLVPVDSAAADFDARWLGKWVAVVLREDRWIIGMPMLARDYDLQLAVDDLGLPGEPRRPLVSIARPVIVRIWGLP